MWYIFKNSVLICTCDNEPNQEDLATRNEVAVYSEIVYDSAIELNSNNQIVVKQSTISELKSQKLTALYREYVQARQSIIWINEKGYDADQGSQNDFAQAFKTLEVLHRNWNGTGDEPTVLYRVWISAQAKQVLPHKLSDFDAAQIAGSQLAYTNFAKFDSLRTQVFNATTISELNSIQW